MRSSAPLLFASYPLSSLGRWQRSRRMVTERWAPAQPAAIRAADAADAGAAVVCEGGRGVESLSWVLASHGNHLWFGVLADDNYRNRNGSGPARQLPHNGPPPLRTWVLLLLLLLLPLLRRPDGTVRVPVDFLVAVKQLRLSSSSSPLSPPSSSRSDRSPSKAAVAPVSAASAGAAAAPVPAAAAAIAAGLWDCEQHPGSSLAVDPDRHDPQRTLESVRLLLRLLEN
jgi:hypothetical protein